jgi:hypothetical protein
MNETSHFEPDPNAVGREAGLAQALRNLMMFTAERFTFSGRCNCDYCRHIRYGQKALRSHGHGDRQSVEMVDTDEDEPDA